MGKLSSKAWNLQHPGLRKSVAVVLQLESNSETNIPTCSSRVSFLSASCAPFQYRYSGLVHWCLVSTGAATAVDGMSAELGRMTDEKHVKARMELGGRIQGKACSASRRPGSDLECHSSKELV